MKLKKLIIFCIIYLLTLPISAQHSFGYAKKLVLLDMAPLRGLGDTINLLKKVNAINSELFADTLTSNGFNNNISFIKVSQRSQKMLKKLLYGRSVIITKKDVLFNDSLRQSIENKFLDSLGDISAIDLQNKFDKDLFLNNALEFQCDYILAYNSLTTTYYRLKGFRQNDFNYFFYDLWNEREDFLDDELDYEYRKKGINKKIFNTLTVSELDLRKLYKCIIKNNNSNCHKSKCECCKSCSFRDEWPPFH